MCSDFSLNKSAVRTKNCSLNMPADQPSAPGCRPDGAINRCMGSVSATSGPDTELQVPDEILQNFGMKTSFSKDVPKLPNIPVIYLHLEGTLNMGKDQPGKVANSARGQLIRENDFFPVPVRAWEFRLARLVRHSRLTSACSSSYSAG